MKYANIAILYPDHQGLGHDVDFRGGLPKSLHWLRVIGIWMERRRQRATLGQLNDHMLADIGLSRDDVWQETEKPFWQA